MVVVIYPGTGTYAGTTQTKWASPAVGATHKFLLFAAQARPADEPAAAHAELAQLGFVEVELGNCKPIDVEVLNEPAMAAFRQYYEGAMAEGFSLVWYP